MDKEIIRSLTILLAEDEKNLQEEVVTNLSFFVKKIITADNGKDALEKFTEYKDEIDIIITDIMMPQMDGISMVDEVRKIDPTIPIIYTTAFNDNEYLLKTIQQNISGYILKPIDMEKLLEAIQKASIVIENKKLKESLIHYNQELEQLVEKKTQELQEQNILLKQQIYTDDLTKLANRKKLLEDIKKLQDPLLILIDIDSFKNINDIYSESFGNQLLIEFATFLRELLSVKQSLYRIGSDQFVILEDKLYNKEELTTFLKYLNTTISSTSLLIKKYQISIKINVTLAAAASTINTLEFADMALRKAKQTKQNFIIYNEDESINEEYREYMVWSKILQDAIEQNAITPYFQPIVDTKLEIVKYESLMRLEIHNKVFSPAYFLDLAKKTKFYNILEQKMIEKCFAIVETKKIPITINISIEDILNEAFVHSIQQNFQNNDIAHLITFEFLESESIYDYEKVIQFIELVKSYGAQIAIDDFGSGYSNFAYLLKLQPHFIKIDGSLIKEIDKNKNSYIIVKTINDFAHALEIKTVAEYVHSQEVLDILQEIGIDYFQGYFLGEPKKW